MQWHLFKNKLRVFLSGEDKLLAHCRLNSDPQYIRKLIKQYQAENKQIDDECLYWAVGNQNPKITSTLLHHGIHGNLYRDDKTDHKLDDRFVLTHAVIPATLMLDYNPLVAQTLRTIWSKPLDTLCVILYMGNGEIDFDSPRLLEHDDTVLIYAARYLDPIVMALLIGAGAPVDKQNAIGETAMMVATSGVYDLVPIRLKIIKQLITAGADPTLLDATGRSVLDYASSQRDKSIRCLISDYYDLFVRRKNGYAARSTEELKRSPDHARN